MSEVRRLEPYHLSFLAGEIGIGVGLAALIANLKAVGATRTVIVASVAGLALCAATSAIPLQDFTIEGPIVIHGWPFRITTTDRYAIPPGPEWLVATVAFWMLVPQIGVYVHRRFFKESEGEAPR